ncbi:MAG TPA: RecQ family ATP-dependent DNA helicase [Conexibacter sp.]|jgi:ATP-dependent DNA helicase RecQ|nr:RecQ family ATP-dependent DNA helicase [Conexibacter sp.]
MDPREALRTHFGFGAFRPGQADAVEAALADRDTLVVMPTGSGKSLCYQLPALMREDLTIVVSPLVSLMQDQVDQLRRIVPERVALVNAQQSAAENRVVMERAAAGELRLLYVAPERFASPGFVEQVERARLGLFVVDEAHCVSQWGHDFRPDYFRLADAARYLRARAIVALTATATPQVARDIVARLRLEEPVQVTTGFDRPNLSFAVVPCRTKADKHRRIAAVLGERDAERPALPAIVYAGTRNGCEELATKLAHALDEPVLVYHAGLDRERRAAVQRSFMGGEARVVVATNAFGMGVDKADVRTVCHETVPQSVEAYYQEAGRAGRDGQPARCLLFAEARDKGLHVFFIQRSEVEDAAFAAVARRLHREAAEHGRYDVELRELAALTGRGGDTDQARAIVGHLARAGMLRPAPSPPDRAIGRVTGAWNREALRACRASAGDAQRVRWRQYRAIWAFVEQRACRRRTVLRHFGDASQPFTDPGVACCDVCDASLVPPAPAAPERAATGSGLRPGADRKRPPSGDVARRGVAPADGQLDEAILAVVESAEPAVGRTRAVEILCGGRSKVVEKHSYDGLPAYGTFAHLRRDDVLARVDELLADGTLRSTGGRFPKLAAA